MTNRGITVIVVLALLALSVPTAADPLGPEKPSDLVTVRGAFFNGPPPGCGAIGNGVPVDVHLLADGGEAPFGVPSDRVLVLTGINWFANSTSAGLDAVLLVLEGPAGANTVFMAITPVGPGGGVAPLSGIAVGPNVTMCFTKSGTWDRTQVFVYGFLTKKTASKGK